ncbi:immunity 26/phosphotriesterase HocA family protein [Fusobacterium pseudoperiodonticum]|uniref:immunity 26/phosphotriesterase HocA family protein n=1 Tax=Fusobacterium pseudoperiodonticum TaxID=2663009 RepID=UPI0028EBCB34|nr:immunity 26/phosphotriesterase HocA family protein [Fusobacterium pseudoperiodonticum]
MKLIFELTNEQRKYLGLIPVEEHWELVKFDNGIYYYFEDDIIRKEIKVSKNYYHEAELNEKTAENRTMILPKTKRGKIKKFNYTATQSFSPFGTYFTFSTDGVIIANYTTQRTYYSEIFSEKEKISLDNLKKWLDKWMKETTEEDLEEIEEFKNAKRKHCKFNEGDFFAFKISRREWCFGRILLDVSKLKKDENFKKNKNYGLANLMGKPLIIKVYHKISDNKNIDLKELSKCLALPSQAIMDNIFYYGEAIILGNLPLKPEENDMFISVSESISGIDKNIAYLQYGLIYREISLSDYEKLIKDLKIGPQTLRREGIGFVIDTYKLKECIEAKSNSPFWEKYKKRNVPDLKNPDHIELKRKIFKAFGLDADKTYEENLKMLEVK